MVMQPVLKTGIRKTGPLTAIAALGTPTLIYQVSPGRTAVIRKIMWQETAGIAGNLEIGHGAGGTWAQDLTDIDAPANLGGNLQEGEIPEQEFIPSPGALTTFDIYAQTDLSTGLQIQVEVEEFGA